MKSNKMPTRQEILAVTLALTQYKKLLTKSLIAIGLIPGLSLSAQAQITTGGDNTQVNPSATPNTTDITGGTTSGTNLFHSFKTFDLPDQQVANFKSDLGIQNILGRINSGLPSTIDGKLQVNGGLSNSVVNLYLMNPAGIVFGQNASLDVNGAFTATTANAIEFGKGKWFNAYGGNSYAELMGAPGVMAFTTNQPGSIFNAANLKNEKPGQNLVLVGGTVISTGTLTTQGGKITIATVDGGRSVRVQSDGTILTLDLPIDTKNQINANAPAFTPLSLPVLLTASDEIKKITADSVTVDNGVVKLIGDTLYTRSISTGDIVTKSLDSSTANVTIAPAEISKFENILDLNEQQLKARSVPGLDGGNISLRTETGDIIVVGSMLTTTEQAIIVSSPGRVFNGIGGNVTINAAGVFRAGGISTGGSGQGAGLGGIAQGVRFPLGAINITHGGTDFVVGAKGKIVKGTGVNSGNSTIEITQNPKFSFPEGTSGTVGGIISRTTNNISNVVYTDKGFASDAGAPGFNITSVPRAQSTPVVTGSEGSTSGSTGGSTGSTGGTTSGSTGGTTSDTGGSTSDTGEAPNKTPQKEPDNNSTETQIAKQQSGVRCDRTANSNSTNQTTSTGETPNTSSADPCNQNVNGTAILQILNSKKSN